MDNAFRVADILYKARVVSQRLFTITSLEEPYLLLITYSIYLTIESNWY